jgi:hypothetical protein
MARVGAWVLEVAACAEQSSDGYLLPALHVVRSQRDARIAPWVRAAEALLSMISQPSRYVSLVPDTPLPLLKGLNEFWSRIVVPDQTGLDAASYCDAITSLYHELCPGITGMKEAAMQDFGFLCEASNRENSLAFPEFAMMVLVAIEPWVKSSEDAVAMFTEYLFPKCMRLVLPSIKCPVTKPYQEKIKVANT